MTPMTPQEDTADGEKPSALLHAAKTRTFCPPTKAVLALHGPEKTC